MTRFPKDPNLVRLLNMSLTAQIKLTVIPACFLLLAWKRWQIAVALYVLATLYNLIDDTSVNPKKDRSWLEFSKDFWIFNRSRKAHNFKLHLDDWQPKPEEDQQYIFALHPHGCMSEFRVLLDSEIQTIFPKLNIRWLAASVLFLLPGVREACFSVFSMCMFFVLLSSKRVF